MCVALAAAPAQAVVFSNILSSADFPAGAVSFADELVDFSPGIVVDPFLNEDVPLMPYLDASNTLGVPDVDLQSAVDCAAAPNPVDCDFASLGVGGVLTLRFTDNLLRGSGDATPDLFVFEAGPPEATFIDISADGVTWETLGSFASFAVGIDLDAAGFGINDLFAYVRLRDDPASGNTSGITVGADIDAIGAISTSIVPLPAAVWLMLSALIGLLCARRPVSRG